MKSHFVFAGLPALACLVAVPSFAVVTYDQNVTPEILFGDGNANGSFTLFQNAAEGLEIGLRAKQRFPAANVYNSNGNGSYSFNPGVPSGQPAGKAEWSYEWSVNTDYTGTSTVKLDDYTYQFILTGSPSTGITAKTFDAINTTNATHGIGNNTTLNGKGDDDIANPGRDAASYAVLIANNNVAQNSWQPTFGEGWTNFDASKTGTYTVTLKVFEAGVEIGSNSINILVPEPASAALLGLAGLTMLRRRRTA